MTAIFKREFRQYLTSMQGYVYLAFTFCFTAIVYYIGVLAGGYSDMTAVVFSQTYYRVLFFGIGIPILTMRLFSQESKNQTDRLLYSSPVSSLEIVMGKFLAALCLFLIGMALMLIFPAHIAIFGKLPIGMTISGFLGMILMGTGLLAICTFVASMIRDTVISAIVSIVVCILILISEIINAYLPNGVVSTMIFLSVLSLLAGVLFYINTKSLGISLAVAIVGLLATILGYFANREWFVYGMTNVINFVSIESRFEIFMNGIIKISSILYLLLVTALFLYLTVARVDAKRWR